MSYQAEGLTEALGSAVGLDERACTAIWSGSRK
jgi:hypothetical protein